MSEIKRLDTKTRKLLTLSKMHHPKADVDRLYLPRNNNNNNNNNNNPIRSYLQNNHDRARYIPKENR